MSTELLVEMIDLTEATINHDNHSVLQRVIRAGWSANNRYYKPSTIEAATPMLEGVKTYVNHPTRSEMRERGSRDLREMTGWLAQPHFKNNAAYATRHVIGEAREWLWPMIVAVVEGNAPASLFGSSINAVGRGEEGEHEGRKGLIIEGITAFNSVDDVDNPAAGGGFDKLIASANTLVADLMAAMSYQEWLTIRSDYIERLRLEHRKVRRNAKLDTANAEAGKYRTMNEQAQDEITRLQEELTAALDEAQLAGREVLVVGLLREAALPAAWEASLRQQLMSTEPDVWPGIIATEQAKAKASGFRPRVDIDDAPQRSGQPLQLTRRMSYEDVKTPEDQEAYLEEQRQ